MLFFSNFKHLYVTIACWRTLELSLREHLPFKNLDFSFRISTSIRKSNSADITRLRSFLGTSFSVGLWLAIYNCVLMRSNQICWIIQWDPMFRGYNIEKFAPRIWSSQGDSKLKFCLHCFLMISSEMKLPPG